MNSPEHMALVEHAPALAEMVLLKTTLSSGELLVQGKTWTGFANSEEDCADSFINMQLQPFRVEDEAAKIEHTNFIVEARFKEFAVGDGNLITGQQQYSAWRRRAWSSRLWANEAPSWRFEAWVMVGVALIGWPFDLGRADFRMGRGPGVLLADNTFVATIAEQVDDLAVERVERVDEDWSEMAKIFELARRLAATGARVVANGRFPLVLAGNCISCLGTLPPLSHHSG